MRVRMSIRVHSTPELPSLDPGVSLLDAPEGRRMPLHTLVLDHALGTRGDVYWVDGGNDASTNPMARLAPTGRVLERIRVARAFTAFQHHALVDATATLVDDEASLVVAANFDRRYRADDLGAGEDDALLVRGLARLAGLARRRDVPVLVTRCQQDGFSEPLERAAHDRITVEETPMGPRFRAAEFETLVYPDGQGFQTTLAYWRRILEARHPEQVEAAATGEVSVHGAD